jgi:hypothetical protein
MLIELQRTCAGAMEEKKDVDLTFIHLVFLFKWHVMDSPCYTLKRSHYVLGVTIDLKNNFCTKLRLLIFYCYFKKNICLQHIGSMGHLWPFNNILYKKARNRKLSKSGSSIYKMIIVELYWKALIFVYRVNFKVIFAKKEHTIDFNFTNDFQQLQK